MDNANEQKWFVYIGDKHEGPFSVAEIGQKIKEGIITTEQYVWCDGMADWLPMMDVSDFKSLAPAKPQPAPAPATPAKTQSATKTPSAVKKTTTLKPASRFSGGRMKVLQGLFLIVALVGVVFSTGVLDKPTQEKISATIFSTAEPVLEILADKVPAVAEFISPIPQIENIKEDDLKNLKTAAKAKLDAGPRAEIVQKITNPIKPTLVIASNLPEGTTLEVWFSGRSETLLNATSFTMKKVAVLNKKIAVLNNITDPSAQPVPKGEYTIYITDAKSDLQSLEAKNYLNTQALRDLPEDLKVPEKKRLIIAKQLFLGGLKDANYQDSLKSYHESMLKKSAQEVNEVKVFFDSTLSQFNMTNNQFNELKKQKNPKARKKLWDPFNKKWEEFGVQLLQSFQSWSPAVLEKSYIQPKLYQALQDAGVKVIKVHQAHDKLTKKIGKILPEEEAEATELRNQAQAALSALQIKLDDIVRAPTTQAGLPRRAE